MGKALRKFAARIRKLFSKPKPKPKLERKKVHPIFSPEVRAENALKKYGISHQVLRRLAKMRKEGKLIYHTSIRGDKIRYFRKYGRWVAPKGERLAIWAEPILIASSKLKKRKGAVSERVIAARHNVYMIKAGRRGKVRIAKKAYESVKYRPVFALREFVSLMEANHRGIPVVEPLRVDVNWEKNSATLYTRMPEGFRDLSTFELIKAVKSESVIRELARQVARMHAKGMFHGDLRRPNILWNGNTIVPKIVFLDLETARFYEDKIPVTKAIDDLMLLTESLCGKWQGIGRFTKEEMHIFADEYCRITAYDKARILHNIERAIPTPDQRTIGDYLRSRLERGAGFK